MTYKEAKESGKPFNRKVYDDGWYLTDFRGYDCHIKDLSIRMPSWSEEDLEATDWVINKTIKERL